MSVDIRSAPDAIDDVALELTQRRRRGVSWSRIAFGAAGVVLAAALWELVAYVKNDPVDVPTVQSVITTFVKYLHTDYPAVGGKPLWGQAIASAERILAGWAIGVVVGVALGGIMASVRIIRYLFDPVIELTRPLPPLAFLPLFIVWFGIGETPKIVLIVVGVVPIITITTVSALDSVPAELVQASRSLGASPVWALLTVRLRAALPPIITGMRVAMGGAWTSIVAVELIAATSGLGYLINQAGQNLQMPLLLSGIVAIAILGIVFDALLRLLHRVADPSTR